MKRSPTPCRRNSSDVPVEQPVQADTGNTAMVLNTGESLHHTDTDVHQPRTSIHQELELPSAPELTYNSDLRTLAVTNNATVLGEYESGPLDLSSAPSLFTESNFATEDLFDDQV